MILQLIWKEGREHVGRLLALVLIVCMPLLAMFAVPKFPRPGDMLGLLMVGSCLAPLWAATWTVASERSRGTWGTLQALPVLRPIVFTVKSVCGLIVVLVPLALGALFVVQARRYVNADESLRVEFFRLIEGMLVWSASFYLAVVALMMGNRREGMVAAVGLLFAFACFMWVVLVQETVFSRNAPAWLHAIFLWPNPAYPLVGWDLHFEPHLPFHVIVSAAIGIIMWWLLGMWRFSRQGVGGRVQGRAQELKTPAVMLDMAPFAMGPFIWREWREQRGLVFAAAIAAVAMAVLLAILIGREASVGDNPTPWQIVAVFVQAMGFIAMIVTGVVAIILGVGSWSADLEPRLMGFWQSRPIDIGQVFWTKYLVAIAGIFALLSFLGIFALTGMLLLDSYSVDAYGLYAAHDSWEYRARLLAGLAMILPLVLTLSTFLVTILRRPIYAATMTVLLIVATVLILHTQDWDDFLIEALAHAGPVLFSAMAWTAGLLTAALALLSRIALARDWRLVRH